MENNLTLNKTINLNFFNFESNHEDVATRLKANLLNKTIIVLMFFLSLLLLMNIYIDVLSNDTPSYVDPIAITVTIVAISIAWVLNRQGRFLTSARLMLSIGTLAIVAVGFLGIAGFLHLITITILAATFLPEKDIWRNIAFTGIFVAIISTIGTGLIQRFTMAPTYPLEFFLLALPALVSYIYHQRQVEEQRRAELEQTNKELAVANVSLKESESVLERRVLQRTEELNIAKQEAEAARDKALEADRIKSQFLANMSHELRTPLNAILNFTGFVAKGVMGPVNERQTDTLNEAIGSGKHLLSLINDILDITKIEAGMMDIFVQEVDMNEIIGASEGIAKGLVKDKPINLISDIQPNLPRSFGDKRRMRQVMLNLISNAVKFTPEGDISIRARYEDNKVKIEVADTGIGIAAQDQDMVFSSFKQAKHELPETIGTGLGMPITKYFIELHHGKIWFDSEMNKGTTFYIELPILTEEEAQDINQQIKAQQEAAVAV